MTSDPALVDETGADENENAVTLAQKGKFGVVLERLRVAPAQWQETDEQGHTVLHWAALWGDTSTVAAGVDACAAAGVTADAPATNLQTPFMWAAIRGRYEAARTLLAAKADARRKDNYGATPLTLAVQHGHYQLMLLIIANNDADKLVADIDNKGCTAMHWAAYKGDLTAIRLLEYFRADLDMLDNEKNTPLHRAASNNQTAACELLAELGARLSTEDEKGRTVIDVLAESTSLASKRTAQLLKHVKAGSSESKDPDLEAAGLMPDARRRVLRRPNPSRWAPPCFWFVSVSLSTFAYIMQLRVIASINWPYLCTFFELGVFASLVLFAVVNQTNPGIVPSRMKGSSGVEEILRAMSLSAPPGLAVPEFDRLCTSTWVLKGLRTKYCTQTKACVADFDHFCGWLNVAIGRGNHRPFIMLAAVEVATQIMHLCLCILCMSDQIKRDGFFDWLYNVGNEYPAVLALIGLQILTIPMILMLLLQHLRMIAMNMTTNEMINSYRYKHFWQETKSTTGHNHKFFVNPFDKGGPRKNCIDFWWDRRRSDFGPKKQACCQHC